MTTEEYITRPIPNNWRVGACHMLNRPRSFRIEVLGVTLGLYN
jgi:hypothetical protein